MVKPLQTALFLLLWSCAATAGADKPKIIQDLQYGEVLFHFYQQNYFTSLTHLMIAEEQSLFQHHQGDAQLLKGGLQLSYGMDQSATAQFASINENTLSADVRNRIAYYLGRIQYQRGNYRAAEHALSTHTAKPDDAIYTRLALLHTNAALASGHPTLTNYGRSNKDDPLSPYLDLSKGIAHVRNNNAKTGWKMLDDIGTTTPESEEALALRDRTNLGLGYELLRSGDFEKSREVLNRVRLDGPFTNAALLGAGWADAERNDFESALRAWLYLFEKTRFDSSVHEAHLAVPYALMKTGNMALAVDYYRKAVDYFNREQDNLYHAGQYTRSDAFLPELETTIPASSGGWLIDAPKIKDLKIGRFLPDLLAEHRFHEPLKDFRDLGYLITNLEQWREKIHSFTYMIHTRRLAYEQKAPALITLLKSGQAQQIAERYQQLSEEMAIRTSSHDPLAFKTAVQAQQWQHLETVIQRASSSPDNKKMQQLRDKAMWLQGVLRWEIHTGAPDARWQLTKRMKMLASDVDTAKQRYQRASSSLSRMGIDFDTYDERIAQYSDTIDALLANLQIAHQTSGEHLQNLIATALHSHQQRIIAYRSQARYALARALDQQSTTEVQTP